MAKKLKYPKKPKATASLATWEKYDKRCKEIDKENNERERDKKKKQSIIERIRKAR